MTNTSEDQGKWLDATLRDAADRMRYTYKTHEKAADRYACYESWRKGISIALTALATGTFVVSIFEILFNKESGQIFTGGLAVLATFAAMLGDFLDFDLRQKEHRAAGVKVRSFFVAYENLRADYLDGAIAVTEARKRRDDLVKSEESLLVELPRTSKKDYEKASTGLEGAEKTSEHQERVLKEDNTTFK